MEEMQFDSEVKDVKAPKKSKRIISIIIGLASIIIGIFTIVSVFAKPSGQSQKLEISNLQFSTEYNEFLGYTAIVSGTAKNSSNRDYSYASIEFVIYDSSGNNLGTALANINNLFKGDTWQFEAHLLSFPSTKPTLYKLVEIIAW